MKRWLLAGLVALLAWPAGAGAWTWPTDGPVLRPFVFGDNPYLGGQHRGLDVGGAAAGSVVAPAGGTVSFAGAVPGGGKTVTIATADGYAVTLVHLGSLLVSRGTVIEEGDPVGAVGPSGVAEHARPYVHLGIRVSAEPQGYVDPLGLLPPRPTSVPPVPPTAPATPASPAPPAAAAPPASAPPVTLPPPVPVSVTPPLPSPVLPPTSPPAVTPPAGFTVPIVSPPTAAVPGQAPGAGRPPLAPPPAAAPLQPPSAPAPVAAPAPVPAPASAPAGAPAAVGAGSPGTSVAVGPLPPGDPRSTPVRPPAGAPSAPPPTAVPPPVAGEAAPAPVATVPAAAAQAPLPPVAAPGSTPAPIEGGGTPAAEGASAPLEAPALPAPPQSVTPGAPPASASVPGLAPAVRSVVGPLPELGQQLRGHVWEANGRPAAPTTRSVLGVHEETRLEALSRAAVALSRANVTEKPAAGTAASPDDGALPAASTGAEPAVGSSPRPASDFRARPPREEPDGAGLAPDRRATPADELPGNAVGTRKRGEWPFAVLVVAIVVGLILLGFLTAAVRLRATGRGFGARPRHEAGACPAPEESSARFGAPAGALGPATLAAASLMSPPETPVPGEAGVGSAAPLTDAGFALPDLPNARLPGRLSCGIDRTATRYGRGSAGETRRRGRARVPARTARRPRSRAAA